MRADIGPAARQAFWATTALAALCLAAALVNPVAGVSAGLILLAFAWGIRRGQAWAAIAAIVHLVAPIAPALRRDWRSVGLTLLIEAVFLVLLVRGVRELWSKPSHRRWWPWAPVAALAGIFWLTCSPFAVSAGSMRNTLLPGDQILVESATWMAGRSPDLGDVVVIRYPADHRRLFIKRIVAGPGDRIRLRDKQLYRNGEAVAESYAIHSAAGVDAFRDNFPAAPTAPIDARAEEMLRYYAREGELEIPDGRYFVLGDNRDDSLDSRYWGFITRADIVGSPVVIYASREARESGAAIRWKRLLRTVR